MMKKVIPRLALSDSEIIDFERMSGLKLPASLKSLYQRYGIPAMRDSEYGFYYVNKMSELVFPFSHFYELVEIMPTCIDLQTNVELKNELDLDLKKLIAFAEGHGQHYFLIGLEGKYYGNIFLLSMEDVEIECISDSLESFISERLVEVEELWS